MNAESNCCISTLYVLVWAVFVRIWGVMCGFSGLMCMRSVILAF